MERDKLQGEAAHPISGQESRFLRDVNTICIDAGRHNVLYNRSTGAVTMVDFEMVKECGLSNVHILEAPELLCIVGRELANISAIPGG